MIMKVCSKCKLNKDVSDFYKDKSKKDNLQNICKVCAKDQAKKYYQSNKEKIAKTSKVYYQNNKDKIQDYYINNRQNKLIYHKLHYQANKERASENNKLWRQNNKEKEETRIKLWKDNNKERYAKTIKKWQQSNPDKCNAKGAKYRASKLQRTPLWANLGLIEAFYTKAQQLTKSTGIIYHVDHIIPLQGKNVSGLHVEYNLQIITASENYSKNNSFTPGAYNAM